MAVPNLDVCRYCRLPIAWGKSLSWARNWLWVRDIRGLFCPVSFLSEFFPSHHHVSDYVRQSQAQSVLQVGQSLLEGIGLSRDVLQNLPVVRRVELVSMVLSLLGLGKCMVNTYSSVEVSVVITSPIVPYLQAAVLSGVARLCLQDLVLPQVYVLSQRAEKDNYISVCLITPRDTWDTKDTPAKYYRVAVVEPPPRLDEEQAPYFCACGLPRALSLLLRHDPKSGTIWLFRAHGKERVMLASLRSVVQNMYWVHTYTSEGANRNLLSSWWSRWSPEEYELLALGWGDLPEMWGLTESAYIRSMNVESLVRHERGTGE